MSDAELAEKADEKAKPEQLTDAATAIEHVWEEVALVLKPQMFDMGSIEVIKREHDKEFKRANAMLYKWVNNFDTTATCRQLILAMCRVKEKSKAGKVFGKDLVEFVQLQGKGRNEETPILDAVQTSKAVNVGASKSPAGNEVALHEHAKGTFSTVADSSGEAAGSLPAGDAYDPRFDGQDTSTQEQDPSVEVNAGSHQPTCSSRRTDETICESHQKADRIGSTELHVYNDICLSGKCIIAVGGKRRPTTVERLDFATNKCTKDKTSKYLKEFGGRYSCGTTVFDNEMYIVGGSCGSCSCSSTLVYSPQTGTIVRKPQLRRARSSCCVSMLGKLLVAVGGYNNGPEVKYLDSVEIWHPENDCEDWKEETSLRLRCPRAGAAVVSVDDHLYCIGGYDGEIALNRMSILNTFEWKTGPQMACPRRDLAAVALENSIYAIGGRDASTPKDTVERIDKSQKKWDFVQKLPTPRYGHSAVVISGKICVVGGDGSPNSIAVYDPRRNSWDKALGYSLSGQRNAVPYRLAMECAFASVAVFDI